MNKKCCICKDIVMGFTTPWERKLNYYFCNDCWEITFGRFTFIPTYKLFTPEIEDSYKSHTEEIKRRIRQKRRL